MPLPENKILVKLSDVSVAYEQMPVLQHFDMSVANDDFVVVTGPNGGGKTTLLRVMLQLMQPSGGAVQYYQQGTVVDKLHIGYLPQKNTIDSRFPISVREVIMSGLYNKTRTLTRGEQEELLGKVITELGLEKLAHSHIGKLSGGQLQRVLLGRAVVSRPQLLVLDEPMSYIDSEWCERIYEMLSRWSEEMAIVMVTHRPELVDKLATQSIRIERDV